MILKQAISKYNTASNILFTKAFKINVIFLKCKCRKSVQAWLKSEFALENVRSPQPL